MANKVTTEREKVWHVWKNMHDRCYKPQRSNYKFYGGKGIKVCERWHDFQNFVDDMGPRNGLTLERNNNDLDYSPDNCRWATRAEQNRNRSISKWIEFRGERLCMAQMAARYGKTKEQFGWRLRSGWTLEEALLIPVSAKNIELRKRGLLGETLLRLTDDGKAS